MTSAFLASRACRLASAAAGAANQPRALPPQHSPCSILLILNSCERTTHTGLPTYIRKKVRKTNTKRKKSPSRNSACCHTSKWKDSNCLVSWLEAERKLSWIQSQEKLEVSSQICMSCTHQCHTSEPAFKP